MANNWLHIGRVLAVNAAHRRIRVSVVPGCGDVFGDCARLRLVVEGNAPVQVRIRCVRTTGMEATVELTPGISRDVVATLKNADVLVPASAMRRSDSDPVGLHDLPGMRVMTSTGDFLGTVAKIQDTPAGGIMRLQCDNAVMATAPVTDAFIEEIDLDAGIITVKDPEAFLVFDLDACSRKSSRRAAQD
ncbi:MAG: PRC-barrel domain-containing protein [Candidatus Hydrogenedentes bacterium]|nr:PRC-barrel domain-containing protein [Candidatus Hydrogenedentota bacterium]